jgi:hypothetical protein
VHKRLLASVLLAGLAVTAGACDVKVGDKGISLDIARGKASDEWVRRYTLPPGGQLDVSDTNGIIQVTAASGPAVEVRVTREARAGSDEAAAQLLRDAAVVEQVTPEQVRVAVKRQEGRGLGLGRSVSVRYYVQVPAGLTASFKTQNGALRLDGVNGRFDVSTVNGSIIARDIAGTITASTVNGGVQLGVTSMSGDVRATAVNGQISIEVPRSIKARLEATTVNGGVSVDNSLALADAERARGHVTGAFNGGGPTIAAQTTNGAIRLLARQGS